MNNYYCLNIILEVISLTPICKLRRQKHVGKHFTDFLRKVGIGAIPELHLRKVGIPTLSADSRIVPDNCRIVQGKYMR